jgi:hypothetical protein
LRRFGGRLGGGMKKSKLEMVKRMLQKGMEIEEATSFV